MGLKELKSILLDDSKVLNVSILIFLCEADFFVADQYVKAIANKNKLDIKYVDDVKNIPLATNSIFGKDSLYVFHTDTFNNIDDYYTKFKNVIVLCKAIKNDNSKNIVLFPKLKEWQVLDYIQTSCPGLSAFSSKQLYERSLKDIYRVENEINKIKIFPKSNQEIMFELLLNSENFNDTVPLNVTLNVPLNIYSLSSAIMSRDMKTIVDVLNNIDYIDIEGTGLVTILKNVIYVLINIQMDKKITAKDLNIKDYQFGIIKSYVGKFTDDKLISMYSFLTSIDYKLKSGQLDLTNHKLVDYILVRIL